MQLGNDIVDLKVDSAIRPRFIERILHADEIRRYPDIHENPLLVWTLWAAKESAFKAYQQSSRRYFLPARWSVDLEGRRVQFGTQSWILDFSSTDDAVVATCAYNTMDFVSELRSAEVELTPREQSAASRKLLAELLERHQLDAVLSKDDGGIPRLTRDNQRLPFSMSHHGRHVYVSVALS